MSGPRHPPLPAFQKRLTLTEQLSKLRQEPQTKQWEVLEQIEKDSKKFKGFRHNAPATQKQQDYHLALYKEWTAFKNGKTVEDYTEEELDELAFPTDNLRALSDNLRYYMIFYFKFATPRSKLTGDKIGYNQLAAARDALVFWLRYKRLQKGLEPIPTAQLYLYMTEAMRAVIKEYPNQLSYHSRSGKAYLGLTELRELIDYEMINNTSIAYSEQHQTVWCIARMTACRPGSVCQGNNTSRWRPLTWRNLTFETLDSPGKIKLTIDFWNIRIKAPNDPEALRRQGAGDDPIHVELLPPTSSNLIFSPAHRLLVIALRRGLLEGITSIDDLFNNDKRYIRIKKEHLDDVLFYRGNPKGEGLDYKAPLSVNGLGSYLKSRCHKLGYTMHFLGMNSIRRRVASDLIARIGTDATRRIMGHSADSFTLERYYMFVGPMLNQSSLTLDEETTATGFEDEYRRHWAPLSDGKLSNAAISRTRGQALRSMVDRLALVDDNPPSNLDSVEGRRIYRKRLRLYAHRALLDQEKEEATANLTREEYQGRQREVRASKFADTVIQKAKALQQSQNGSEHPPEDSFGLDDSDALDGDEEDEEEEVGEEEQDMEDTANPGETITIAQEHDASLELEAADDETTYDSYVRALMETLLYNTMNVKHTWAEGDTTCPECQQDDTADEDAKTKDWPSKQKLDAHLTSNFHSMHSRFRRRIEQRRAESELDMYVCPYCEATCDPDAKPKAYTSIQSLERHITGSDADSAGVQHDKLKDNDGWYDIAFFPKPLKETHEKALQLGRRNIEKWGMHVKMNPPPKAYPVSGMAGVFKSAGTLLDGIPSKFVPLVNAGLLTRGTQKTSGEIPSRFASAVKRGADEQPFPDHIAKLIRSGLITRGSDKAKLPQAASIVQSTGTQTAVPKRVQDLINDGRITRGSGPPPPAATPITQLPAGTAKGRNVDDAMEISSEEESSGEDNDDEEEE